LIIDSYSAQERAQILYEISMAIGTTLNLNEMLKTSLSVIIKKLNCSTGFIYSQNGGCIELELILSIPKRIPSKQAYAEKVKYLLENDQLILEEAGNYHYLFPLLNYGYLLLIKKDRRLDDFIIQSLEPVTLKLSSAIHACLSTEDLNQQIEREVNKNREKDAILFQQARLTSIGEMIGNIAHQWRQPLNSVGIMIQDLIEAEEYGEIDKEFIENFVDEAMVKVNYMSRTIDDFRDFFKPNKAPQDFDVLTILDQSVSLVKDRLKSESIELIYNREKNFSVSGYPNEFSQVAVNILNNAKDVLITKTSERWIKIDICESSRAVIIEDSGGGIPDEIIKKIFEPYFTTKHQSSGTGIGLYMSKMIIEDNMNGQLIVENSENGAVFKIKL
jgi:signal transduction histidine kinase